MKANDQARIDALKELRTMLKPGDTVYTVLRHVSSSGMSRRISVVAIGKDRKPLVLDWWIEKLGTYKRHSKHEGLVVGGCGMDMGFHLVYGLGAAMWPNGTPKPHGVRNGSPDNAGGYALNHRWI